MSGLCSFSTAMDNMLRKEEPFRQFSQRDQEKATLLAKAGENSSQIELNIEM